MNLDFKLDKNEKNEQIIKKLKKSTDNKWYKFKNEHQLLSIHDCLKILPPSKANYKSKLSITKFVKTNLIDLYHEESTNKFKYIGEYLEEYKDKDKIKKSENPKNYLWKISTLKFDSKYNSILYFINLFKKLTTDIPDSGKKYYLKKIISKTDQMLIGDFDVISIDLIFQRMYYQFNNSNMQSINDLNNLKLENFENLDSFIDKNFEFLDNIYYELKESDKIEFIINKFENIKPYFNKDYFDKQSFNFRRMFKITINKFYRSNTNLFIS